MKSRAAIVIGALAALLPAAAFATKVWVGPLANWSLYLDNGVAYVLSTSIPSNCSYSRAQIATGAPLLGSATYARDLYAFVLASYEASKSLNIVIETTETTCSVYGAQN